MKKKEKETITVLSLSHFFCHVAILTYPAILILIKHKFHTNYEVLGTVAGIYLFLFGAGSLPIGIIADKVNKKHILRVYLLGMAVSAFAAAVSTNFYSFAAAIIFMGLIGSIYHPVGLSMMSFVGGDKLRAFAIHGIAGTLGVALSAGFAGILGYFFGYNFPYLMLGIIFLSILFLSYLFNSDVGAEKFADKNNVNKDIVNSVNGKSAINIPKDGKISIKDSMSGFIKEFFHINLILIFIVEFLNGFVFQGVFSFLPAYVGIELKNYLFFHNQAAAAGGFFVTIALIIGVIFQYNSTRITKNYKSNRAFSFLTLASGIFLLISGFSHDIILFIAILVFSAFNFSINPISNLMISENAHEKYRATAYGIFFFSGFGIGSVAAPIGGIIAQKFALHWIFVFLGVILLFSFLISNMIREGKYK